MGLPYDYYSIMHYTPFSFSINGLPTIVAKQPNVQFLHSSQKNSLTSIDAAEIRTLYRCSIIIWEITKFWLNILIKS